MRLSQYKEPNNVPQQQREQSFTVDQISKHQYFKKDLSATSTTGIGKNTVTARNGFGVTQTAPDGTIRDQMNNTNRYNPIKHLKDPKKILGTDSVNEGQINEENAEDGSTGGNTMRSPFF